MKATSGVTKNELLSYVRQEEDEGTTELLTTSSFLRVGLVVRDGVTFHYWSYPTPYDVAWVSFSSENVLSMEVEGDIPLAIKDATASREQHTVRKPRREVARPVDRLPIAKPTWVPKKYAPVCHYYPVWREPISFQHALKAFGAKPTRENVGYSLLGICIKLTRGRYALIDAPEDRQESISISLELEEDAETRKDENCIGLVRSSDIKEILGVLGQEYEPPLLRYPYQWRE
jgi:hypothetical protein